jgi:hypothetical protein
VTCVVDAECDVAQCLKDAESYEDFLESDCCEECQDTIDEAQTCIEECIPECVYETTVAYAICVSIDVYDCETSCTEKLEEYQALAEETVEGAIADVYADSEEGTYDVDIEFDGITYSEDNFTCSDLEAIGESYSDEVCDIASCCPYCIDEFEVLTECSEL